jgi:ribosomal protein L22
LKNTPKTPKYIEEIRNKILDRDSANHSEKRTEKLKFAFSSSPKKKKSSVYKKVNNQQNQQANQNLENSRKQFKNLVKYFKHCQNQSQISDEYSPSPKGSSKGLLTNSDLEIEAKAYTKVPNKKFAKSVKNIYKNSPNSQDVG